MGLQEGAKMSAHQRDVGVPTGLKSSHSQLQKFQHLQAVLNFRAMAKQPKLCPKEQISKIKEEIREKVPEKDHAESDEEGSDQDESESEGDNLEAMDAEGEQVEGNNDLFKKNLWVPYDNSFLVD